MTKKFVLIVVSIILIAIIVGAIFYQYEHKKNDTLIIYGNVDVRQADLGFRVLGRVSEMYFDEGQLARKGEVMAALDKIPQEEEFSQAQAKKATIEASLEKARSILKRRQDSVKTGAVSQENYDDAFYNVKELDAQLEQANASLESAKTKVEDTQILAPADGIVLTRIREPGAVVNIGDPVYALSILSPVWIRTYVSEPDLGKIYQGMRAEVVTDTKGIGPYEGYIGFISPVAEFTPKNVETTKLRADLVYQVRVVVYNPDLYLKQGMPVTVNIYPEKEKEVQALSKG